MLLARFSQTAGCRFITWVLIYAMLAWSIVLPAHAAGPVANAGPDRVLEQSHLGGRTLQLDGGGSSDPDGDPLNYQWFGPFGNARGSTPVVAVSTGAHRVSLVVDDGNETASDSALITIEPCFAVDARAKRDKVQLTWTAQSNAVRYDIYRASSAAPTQFAKVAATPPDRPLYLDAPLPSEVSYLYTVATVTAAGACFSAVTASHPTTQRGAINQPPVIFTAALTDAATGLPYTYDVGAADPNLDVLSYALVTAPAGMTIEAATGLIEWLPPAAGAVEVEVAVHDGQGRSATQRFTVNVQDVAIGNARPVADAGSDQSVFVTATVQLDGSGSADPDGDPLTYAWTLIERPAGSDAALSNPTAVMPTFVADRPGTYRAQLVVNDGQFASVPGTVTITTENSPPVADAGAARSGFVNDPIVLDGTGSTDVDGDPLTFAWSFVTRPAGSSAAFDDPSQAKPRFVIDRFGQYIAQLVVNDGARDSAPATVAITTLNSPPVADAGSDQAGFVGAPITLDGSASSDVDGDLLGFRWNLTSVPAGSGAALDDDTAVKPSFVIDVFGEYVAQLIVNDGKVDSAPDTVKAISLNSAPIADAGPDQRGALGATITLNGTGSRDVDGDPLTFAWSFTSRPAGSSAAFDDATSATPSFTIDVSGDYVAQLIVNDGQVDSAPATVTVSTENTKPVADAGPDQTVDGGATVALDGAGSRDADGDPLTFAWSFTARPAGSSAALDDPSATQPSFVADRPGLYVVQLIVHDGTEPSAPDTVSIEVLARVPDVVGQPQADAETAITAAGLAVGAVTSANSDTVPAGRVIGQAPAAGTSVAAGTAVDLVVSLGPALVAVPAVVGQPQASAQAAILAAGLTVGAVTSANSATVPAGSVISQAPVGGDSVAAGTAVNLVVSDGPAAPAANRAPQITSTPVSAATVDAPYTYVVGASDADGDPLRFDLSAAPTGMAIDPVSGLITWTPTAAQIGSGSVSVQVSDGTAAVDQHFTVVVQPSTSALVVTATVSPAIANPGEVITITATVSGGNNAQITMLQGGAPLLVTNGVAQFSAVNPGAYPILVTATTADGRAAETTAFARVRDAVDSTAPVAVITAPTEDSRLVGATAIVGTANDARLFRYRLSLAPSGSSNFTEFATGFAPVVNGTLGTLDPSRLANGLYQVVLVVEDVNGRTSQATVNVLIEGEAKPGLVRLGFTDMVVPVAGIPITIERTYDSRIKTGRDFGIGWSLDIRQGSYRNNREPGRGWNVVGSGGFFNIPCSRAVELASHTTEVRLSDRERYAFRPVASFSGFGSVISGGCVGTVSFTQTDGLRGATLVPLESNKVFFQNGSGILTFDLGDERFGEPWQPDRVRLQTADGRTFDVDLQDGITRLEDRTGNQLVISNSGIVNGAGVGVQFQRDGQGRLTRITDPRGNSVRYEYDANGDLVRFINQADEETTYEYFAATPHHLSVIRLPDGRLVNSFDYDADGRLARGCTDLGCATSQYDLVGRSQTNIDATGRRITYVYDANGNVLSQTDDLGNRISYVYDARGNVTQQTDAEGNVTQQSWDATGNLLSVTRPFGPGQNAADFTTTYSYDSRGFMLRSRLPSGGELNNSYDGAGNVLTMTNQAGTVLSSFTYDAAGRRTSETDPFGRLDYGYGADGLLATIAEPGGVTAGFTNDAAGNVTGINRAGRTTTLGYDAFGRQASLTDSTGVTLNYDYDFGSDWTSAGGTTVPRIERRFTTNGAPSQVTQADGATVRWDYDAAGRVTAEVDALGARTSYRYDAAGRLSEETDPNGNTTRYERDGDGRVLAVINADGERSEYSYHPDGSRRTITNGEGETWTFSYTPTTITVRDPLLRQVTTETNPHGLITRMLNADNTSRAWTYLAPTELLDGADMPTSFTDEAGRHRDFSYDAEGFLIGATDLAGIGATYSYGAEGLAQTVDAEGETIAFTYNARGDVRTLTFGDGSGKTLDYLPSGDVERVTLASGLARTLRYDPVGRVTRDQRGPGETFELTYDANGNLLAATDADGTASFAYDAAGNPLRVTNSAGASITYTHDQTGRVVTQTVANLDGSQTRQTHYDYDRAGRLTRLVDPNGGETRFSYDDAGRLVTRVLPNGVTTSYTYDLRDQLIGVAHVNAAGITLLALTYDRNPGGEPRRITWQDGSYLLLSYDVALRIVDEAFYDPTDRLTRRIQYEYDRVGNRTARVINGARTEYGYGGAHRLLSASGAEPQGYQYDADGRARRLQRGGVDADLGYNFAGQIASFVGGGQSIAYTYDAAGRRIAAAGATNVRRFLRAPGVLGTLDQPQAVFDDSGDLLQSYVFAGNDPIARSGAGGTRYYLTDALGSVIGITDEAGNLLGTTRYDAFGRAIEVTGDMAPPAAAGGDFRFHGQWLEGATGLYDLRARDYDPVTGRFLAPDPAEPDLFEPESLNRYLFANANPYLFSDPTGRFTLISVNISFSIQSTLRSIAINIAKDYFLDKARSVAGSILISALRNFAALEGFNPWGFIGVTNPRDAGRIWEQKVQQFICSVFPDVLRGIVWFEPTIAGGYATSNGYGCPGGGSGGFATAGSAKPDFMLTKTEPRRLGRPGYSSIKAYLIGEAKWRLKTFYNSYVSPGRQRRQFNQIAEFAQDRVYARTAIFVALLNGTNTQEAAALTALLTAAATSRGIIPIMVSAQ